MDVVAWAQHRFGFGRAGKDDAPSVKAVPDKPRFRFSPDLIRCLKADHDELLRQYGEIETMALAGRLGALPGLLAAFQAKLEVHALSENLHCCCYLEQRLAGDAGALQRVRELRAEMDALARGVAGFVKTCRAHGMRPSNAPEFVKGLRAIGTLLVQRVARAEKELYPLYQP